MDRPNRGLIIGILGINLAWGFVNSEQLECIKPDDTVDTPYWARFSPREYKNISVKTGSGLVATTATSTSYETEIGDYEIS